MFHPLLKAALRFFCISLLLILPAKIAGACTCGPTPTVLEAYEAANEVLIVRVLSLETVEQTSGVRPYIDARPAIVRVERVYKGQSRVNDQLVFGTSVLGCARMFDQNAIGKEYLLYLKRPADARDYWQASFCDRSNKLEYAGEDVSYLDNQQTLRGKTRISGMYFGTQFELLSAANRKIRISGGQKTYEIYTDKNGVYEIYDLPPGKYRIEPELPTGWKFYGWYPESTTRIFGKSPTGESGQFVLEPGKHASINMLFRPDSSVQGKIVGPNGTPLRSLCVSLLRPNEADETSDTACTNEKGRFLFESVVPGSYLLVLNPSDEPSGAEPFRRLFYPGVADREKAVAIDVAAGEKLREINMVVSELLETVTVAGVVYFSDDRPARNQTVRFLPGGTSDTKRSPAVQTDEKGRFSLKLFKGSAGSLSSETYVKAGMFGNCPAFDALLPNSSQKVVVFNTPSIRIEADHNIRGLVLRFTFPMCNSKD